MPEFRLDADARLLVTGAAGFIGFHVAERLLAMGHGVTGVDNLNAYYDPALKQARLDLLGQHPGFRFQRTDLADRSATADVFAQLRPTHVIHLAAQAGVRHSLTHPFDYADANLTGFLTVLEGCRSVAARHLVFASTSSVYGANTRLPFAVTDAVDHPVSLYAATKKANELMAHTYSHLYRLPVTGLRFFTVYGPWGRPDMAYYSFTRKILGGEPIEIYNHGQMRRDFTYIDDIVEGVIRTAATIPTPDPGWDAARPDPSRSSAPYRLYNIGNNRPVPLLEFIDTLEAVLGRTAVRQYRGLQLGDVVETAADIDALEQAVGFRPATPLATGLERFARWYKDFHGT